ncbi:MAG: DNA gyrase subunit A [Caldisericaceae bacterium]
MSDLFGEKVLNAPLEEEVQKSFIDYSVSVIIGRALPDIRDGLKPVHRRILYSMNELGCYPNRPYKKCARIVGEVLGKYHPHGDASVYDALVRMAQSFSLRYPIVDGHGNFGSIDGDVPAAMRYTEARLSPIALELLSGLDEDTVDFIPNFDNTLKEPVVLPARIPNLLINGSSGIAVGMATNIPPHNLKEVIDGLLFIIDKEILGGNEVDGSELSNFIKGPDFPTGGYVIGESGIKDYFNTGRGSFRIRGKWHIEETKHKTRNFVITELPFEVNKATLVEKIANLTKDKKLKGVEDIRDESDRDGIRIVIKIAQDVDPKILEISLANQTSFEVSYGVILLGVLDNSPKVFTLKELLSHFLSFRAEILRKQTEFELDKAKNHLMILEGLRKAILNIDSVVSLIRGSKDTQEALIGLMNMLSANEAQCKAILDMRLSRLTSLEINRLEDEISSTTQEIEKLERILSDKSIFWNEISEDLKRIALTYPGDRKTQIKAKEELIDAETLIEDNPVIITVTRDGYVKRLPQDTFRIQARGGKGVIGSVSNEFDYPKDIIATTAKSKVLFFTNKGRVYGLKAFEIPESDRDLKGTPIHRLLRIDENEVFSATIALSKDIDVSSVALITKKGLVKRTSIKAFETINTNGKIAVSLTEGDEIVSVTFLRNSEEIIIVTNNGYTIRFDSGDVRLVGRTARGVKGINLSAEDFVVDGETVKDSDTLLIITSNGRGKRIIVSELRKIKRGGKGVLCLRTTAKTGPVRAVKVLHGEKSLFIMSKKGKVIKIDVEKIPLLHRFTSGVKVISFAHSEDEVASVTVG